MHVLISSQTVGQRRKGKRRTNNYIYIYIYKIYIYIYASISLHNNTTIKNNLDQCKQFILHKSNTLTSKKR